MQTVTFKELKQNSTSLYNSNEPIVFKNKENQFFLLTPLSPDRWQEIAMLYSLSNMTIQEKKRESFEEFDKKWGGFMKDVQISENWREEYINDKMSKHQ